MQVTRVLNSYSDSILVVEKTQVDGHKQQLPSTAEEDVRDVPKIQVPFCNRKSQELFGFNLREAYSSHVSVRYLEEPVLFSLTHAPGQKQHVQEMPQLKSVGNLSLSDMLLSKLNPSSEEEQAEEYY